MDVTFGMTHVQREITVDVDKPHNEITALVDKALADGAPIKLEDNRGRTLVIPSERLAYAIIGTGEQRRVGFSL